MKRPDESNEVTTLGYYQISRSELLDLHTWKGGEYVLDIGCGAGGNADYLRAKGARWLTGIEVLPEMALRARKVFDEVLEGTVEKRLDDVPEPPDVMIAADVLEHTVDPLGVLHELRRVATSGTELLVSLPNVRHISVLRMLVIKGDWTYSDSGILDRTHLRWFTRRSALRLLEDGGWRVDLVEPKFNTSKQARWNTRTHGFAVEFLAEQLLFRCRPA